MWYYRGVIYYSAHLLNLLLSLTTQLVFSGKEVCTLHVKFCQACDDQPLHFFKNVTDVSLNWIQTHTAGTRENHCNEACFDAPAMTASLPWSLKLTPASLTEIATHPSDRFPTSMKIVAERECRSVTHLTTKTTSIPAPEPAYVSLLRPSDRALCINL